VESRHLLQRMVDYMLGQGVRQFLDLGSGLPNMASMTGEAHPEAAEGLFRMTQDLHWNTPLISRSRTDIARFFDGFTLVEPGLVRPAQWRPDLDNPLRESRDAPESSEGDGQPLLRPAATEPPGGDAAWHFSGVGIKD
jgi:hypothetical protein